MKKADFSNVQFKKIASFIESQFAGIALFSNTCFDETSITKFQLVQFLDIAFFFNACFLGKENDFSGTVFIKNAVFSEVKINNSNRESFRIIKNEMIKNNNRINALYFHQKEMMAYWTDLFGNNVWDNIKTKNILKKWHYG